MDISKKVVFLICGLIFTLNIQSQNFKLKTYKTKEYSLNYPSIWEKFKFHGNINFTPKDFRKVGIPKTLHNLYINVSKKKDKNLEDLAKAILHQSEKVNLVKESKITKHKKSGKLFYIINVSYEHGVKRKKLIHLYEHEGYIYYLDFSARNDIFDIFINEANVIFNSFEFI